YSIRRVDGFLIDCPPEVNKYETGAELIKMTRKTLLPNKSHFKRSQLTPEEFVALLGLVMWREQKYTVSIRLEEDLIMLRDWATYSA
ncbi:hypothetical protein PMAYCL1PPCAC_10516, partial [Pristionchus mayeri]